MKQACRQIPVSVFAPGAVERFWSHVDKKRDEECWMWTGYRGQRDGYGRIRCDDRSVLAHRVSFTLASGADPGELFVCHRCDVRGCVNPSHLFLGTNRDNAIDARSKGRLATGARHGSHTMPNNTRRGEAHYKARATAGLVREIRRLAGTASQYAIARRLGLSRGTVKDIIHRKTWKHVSDDPVAEGQATASPRRKAVSQQSEAA